MTRVSSTPSSPVRVSSHTACGWKIRARLGALFLATIAALSPGPAAAQSLAGQWQAGITVMNVDVESWGPDCGPEPKSSRSDSGGTVQIGQEGSEVVIHGRGGDLRTDRCWSRNAAVRRRSSRYLNGEWTTQCQTPKNDPRAESGTYTLKKVSENELQYIDVSEYNWQLKTSTCVATIRTTQTLRRVVATGKPAAGSAEGTKSAPAESKQQGCTPSIPTKLALRPERAKVELGEEVCFRASVSDALGCLVRGAKVSYSLSHSPALRGTLTNNCFRSSENAAEGEGEFRVTASAGALKAQAVVQVSAMDLSDLIAKRLEVGAISGFEEGDMPEEQAVGSATMGVSAEQTVEQASGSPLLPLLLACAGVLVLLGALWFVRRKNASPPATPRDSALSVPQGQPSAMTAQASKAGSEIPGAAENWICPNCRRGFAASQHTCPHCVGEVALMPYSEFVQRSKQQEAQDSRCRACGARCEGAARFCGECGSQDLEMII